MSDYELFLKLMDEELSKDELFYLSLSHDNFPTIFHYSEYTKELKKEYPSIVYKGNNIVCYNLEFVKLSNYYKIINTYFSYIEENTFSILGRNFYLNVSIENETEVITRTISSTFPYFYNIKDAEKYKEWFKSVKDNK